MTEAEWLACEEPDAMIAFLVERGASERKLRLFAVACYRALYPLYEKGFDRTDPLAQANLRKTPEWTAQRRRERREQDGRALSLAEQYADGEAGADALAYIGHYAYTPLARLRWTDATVVARTAEAEVGDMVRFEAAEPIGHGRLLLDVFGNPFCPARLAPAWLAPTGVAIAKAAYDARHLSSGRLDNARLAVLSDALEEAGCTDDAILSHLRSPGPHVRGCWALDLVLGRE